MSRAYDQYLEIHKNGVRQAFEWIKTNLPDLLHDIPGVDYEHQICFAHDDSKTNLDEYKAYDAYFYGGNRSYQVMQDFNKAWLLHIHRNPHHWQYWVLINDDPENGEVVLDMDYNYIIEMICDWWSFSWKSGNLREIFSWYDQHRAGMKLSEKTRQHVELILTAIDIELGGLG